MSVIALLFYGIGTLIDSMLDKNKGAQSWA